MRALKRRTLLQASAGLLAAPQIMAQSKPEKLVYVGDNGPWHYAMVEEVAPAFEKATGIKIDFTLLPVDPWRARLRAELGSGSSGIDIVQFSVSMTGWMSPHMEDHEPLLAQIKAQHADFDWNDYLTGTKKAASYEGKLCGLPYRITTGIFHYQKALLERAGFAKPPENWEQFLKTAQAVNTPPERYGYGLMGMQGAGMYSCLASWLFSNGGARMVDFKTGEVFINDAKAVEALQFYGDLNTKYRSGAAGCDDLAIRGNCRRRPARPLCHGADVRALRHADQRSEDLEDRRQMGMDHGARSAQQRGRTHLDRRPHDRRAEIHQEQGMGTGVRGDVLQP